MISKKLKIISGESTDSIKWGSSLAYMAHRANDAPNAEETTTSVMSVCFYKLKDKCKGINLSLWRRENALFVRVDDEPFYRAALCRSPFSDTIDVMSHHFDTTACGRVARRPFWACQSNSRDRTININERLSSLSSVVSAYVLKAINTEPLTLGSLERLIVSSTGNALLNDALGSDLEVSNKIRDYMISYHSRLRQDTLIAAFEALEHLVCEGRKPDLSKVSHMNEFLTAVKEVNMIREKVHISKELFPVHIVKVAGKPTFHISSGGYTKDVEQLPDSVTVQVATLMSCGEGSQSVCGVGTKEETVYPVELNMVVAVPRGVLV